MALWKGDWGDNPTYRSYSPRILEPYVREVHQVHQATNVFFLSNRGPSDAWVSWTVQIVAHHLLDCIHGFQEAPAQERSIQKRIYAQGFACTTS